MDNETIIKKTVDFVKTTLHDAEGGHDWWHIYRVWKNTQHIAITEKNVDQLVVQLGALLHDIADSKFHSEDEEVGPTTASTFLESLGVEEVTISQVENIVRHISFKGSMEGQKWSSAELSVVQDADRLDAIGAIGIGRTFTYGGHTGKTLYDPGVPPNLNMTKTEYKIQQQDSTPTLNHFYEKLLLLKDLMNTKTGKSMAQSRHDFMENYLEQFRAEWEGLR